MEPTAAITLKPAQIVNHPIVFFISRQNLQVLSVSFMLCGGQLPLPTVAISCNQRATEMRAYKNQLPICGAVLRWPGENHSVVDLK